jgi:hypothetical protein
MTYICGGSYKELIVTSPYLQYDLDEPLPTKELRDAIDYHYSKKNLLIIGYDANAHHILWGTLAPNPEEKALWNIL